MEQSSTSESEANYDNQRELGNSDRQSLPDQLRGFVVERKSLHDSDSKVLVDDNRSLSSQKSESGYLSSGALSDGREQNPMSSLRSLGSVGSHGSSRSGGHTRRFSSGRSAALVMLGDNRFPSAMSYASTEAPKSDIATVCSSSIVEDIDLSSVEMNVPPTPSNVLLSTHSDRPGLSGNLRRSGSGVGTRAVEFAPSSIHYKNAFSSRGSLPHNTTISVSNDMGPPLSRALLMQRDQSTGAGSATDSRAGSVRSFGSRASDVVAHVDTDDCGGSVTDGQSCHSQEDIRTDMEESKDGGSAPAPHNPLKSSSDSANGRTSPGGTIYKGRGVRLYQGRFMNLPLKRFHQNGANVDDHMGVAIHQSLQDETSYGRSYYDPRQRDRWERSRGRSFSPDSHVRRHSPNDEPARRRSRSRSRSSSRSTSRSPRRRGGRRRGRRFNDSNSPSRNRRSRSRRGNRGDHKRRYKGK